MRPRTVAITVVIVILLGGIAVGRASGTAVLCGSCHEMQDAAHAWRTSSHKQGGCATCHEEPSLWYEIPKQVTQRTSLLRRCLEFKVRGIRPMPVGAETLVPDDRCGRCHNPDREMTIRRGILIDHAEHARRNTACVTCHLELAHPEPTEFRATRFMGRCFECHGQEASSNAPGDCELCHPRDYVLMPKTHRIAGWDKKHPDSWRTGKEDCTICHAKSFCTDCHGVEMPHPAEWTERSSPRKHSIVAETKGRACVQCHGREPGSCIRCHHTAYDPGKGSWKAQHVDAGKNAGVAGCLPCHTPTSCAKCHAKERRRPAQS